MTVALWVEHIPTLMSSLCCLVDLRWGHVPLTMEWQVQMIGHPISSRNYISSR